MNQPERNPAGTAPLGSPSCLKYHPPAVIYASESDPEDLAHISPYLTEHINRFGEYSTHELAIQPEAYDPKLDVDFTPLREQDLTAAGLGQAA
ncbi:hypothetical protein [Streptomyces sp. NBC_01669]|uniref:hypothetical protein n=1 Tax=Streptomyces sp. NBC_01669 TaxID=2975909 RepID=UPI002256EA7A|nr:hypothetical protein [Streptomyces sp. NBC_01669]MCX4538162.1 transposase [Streptomyces sp. NBC_01669]